MAKREGIKRPARQPGEETRIEQLVPPRRFDVAIVGGGASGLAAAVAAAGQGADVVVLERLSRVGKKLLATGNGRCNLGNLDRSPDRYHGSVDTADILNHFPGEQAFFSPLGLYVRPDEEGRLYPMSNQASSVLDALRLACQRHGVVTLCEFPVEEIAGQAGRFRLLSGGQTARAKRVILAAGGCAAPQFGTDGAGVRLASALGHSVSRCYPALVPVGADPRALRPFKGLRVYAQVTAVKLGQVVGCEQGQVQFTERALSGICVFNLAQCKPDTLSLDLVPWCDDPAGMLDGIVTARREAALEDLLTGLLPKRIGQALLKICTDQPLTAPVSTLGKRELEVLAGLLKRWEFAVVSAVSWDSAQVTAGGVTGIGATLESPIVPGLYFAGEVLDVHGDCGGYNLRWAWASGSAAGRHAARSVNHDQNQ